MRVRPSASLPWDRGTAWSMRCLAPLEWGVGLGSWAGSFWNGQALDSAECTHEADTRLSCQNSHPGNAGRGRWRRRTCVRGDVQKDTACPWGQLWRALGWSGRRQGLALESSLQMSALGDLRCCLDGEADKQRLYHCPGA